MARWEEESNERKYPGTIEIITGALIPGVPVATSQFESVYVDKDSGRRVSGTGDSPEEARKNAQNQI